MCHSKFPRGNSGCSCVLIFFIPHHGDGGEMDCSSVGFICICFRFAPLFVFFSFFLYFLSSICHKKKSVWVSGSSTHNGEMDNSMCVAFICMYLRFSPLYFFLSFLLFNVPLSNILFSSFLLPIIRLIGSFFYLKIGL